MCDVQAHAKFSRWEIGDQLQLNRSVVVKVAKFSRWEIGDQLQRWVFGTPMASEFSRWEIGDQLQPRSSRNAATTSLADGRSGTSCNRTATAHRQMSSLADGRSGTSCNEGQFAPSLMFNFRARRVDDRGRSRTSIYRLGGCRWPDALGQPTISPGKSVEGTICLAILSRDAHRVVMHLYNAHHAGNASDAHPGWRLSY